MDHIFLDASILFSAAQHKNGRPSLWELEERGRCKFFSSRYAIEKARRNLYDQGLRQRLDQLVSTVNIVLEADQRAFCPVPLPESAKAILLSAISSGADYLITVDISSFREILRKEISGVTPLSVRDYILNEAAYKPCSSKILQK